MNCPNCGAKPASGRGYPVFVKWVCGSYSRYEQSNECIAAQKLKEEAKQ